MSKNLDFEVEVLLISGEQAKKWPRNLKSESQFWSRSHFFKIKVFLTFVNTFWSPAFQRPRSRWLSRSKRSSFLWSPFEFYWSRSGDFFNIEVTFWQSRSRFLNFYQSISGPLEFRQPFIFSLLVDHTFSSSQEKIKKRSPF